MGTDFWVTFMPNGDIGEDLAGTSTGNPLTFSILVTSKRNCNVYIYHQTSASTQGTMGPYPITANQARTITVEASSCYTASANSAQYRSIHIVATDTISVFASNFAAASFDITNVLPTSTLTNEYIVQTYPAGYGSFTRQDSFIDGSYGSGTITSAPSNEFVVVATEDNTTVSITPACATSNGWSANSEHQVTLNRGQCYLVSSATPSGSTLMDLSGSKVTASDCKKIAVFQGSESLFIPRNFPYADHIYEQSIPTAYWGKKYIATNSLGIGGNRPVDYVRVTAMNDNCQVRVDGNLRSTLQAGQTYEFNIGATTPTAYIETTEPATAYLYTASITLPNASATSPGYSSRPIQAYEWVCTAWAAWDLLHIGDCKGGYYELTTVGSSYSPTMQTTGGDPASVLLTPIEQQIDEITFATFSTDRIEAANNYVNIVTKTSDVGGMNLDGTSIGNQFTTVTGNTQYSYARLNVAAGSHTLKNTIAGAGFIAHSYGCGAEESYAYSCGSRMLDLNSRLLVNGEDVNMIPGGATVCAGQEVTLLSEIEYAYDNVTISTGDGAMLTGVNATHTYPTQGDYEIEVVISRQSTACAFDTLRTTIHVRNAVTSETSATECGNLYTWNGQSCTATGDYYANFQTTVGDCDSVAILHLTLNPGTFNSESVLCTDASYTWHGQTYTAPGTYTYSYTDGNGCPSVDTLHLSMCNTPGMSQTVQACNTYSWIVGGQNYGTYTTSGQYTHSHVESGCTIIDTLNLTINQSRTSSFNQEACVRFTWLGQTYSNSGNYNHTFQTTAGCDSIVTMHLTIYPNVTHTETLHACDRYTWSANGVTYENSINGAMAHLVSTHGCDSTVTLNLTINHTGSAQIFDTICADETYNFRGNTYNASGTYEVTITSPVTQCDSIYTIYLMKREPINLTISETHSCELGYYQITTDYNNGDAYRWTSNPNDPDLASQTTADIMVSPTTMTTYTLTVGYRHGRGMDCPVSRGLTLYPLEAPHAAISAEPEWLTVENTHYSATNHSTNADRVEWFVDGIYVNASEYIEGDADNSADSVVIALVAYKANCMDTATIVLPIKKSAIWVPNVFTPTLHSNKIFNAMGVGLLDYELYVYTREGLLVYHTTTLEGGWDGTYRGLDCKQDTYTYIIRYRTDINPEVWEKMTGTVMLLK